MLPGIPGEQEGGDEREDAEAREHQFHGDRRTGFAAQDAAGQALEYQQAQVLDPVDEREGRAQDLVRDDLRDARPQRGRDQGEPKPSIAMAR